MIAWITTLLIGGAAAMTTAHAAISPSEVLIFAAVAQGMLFGMLLGLRFAEIARE